jgi:hypothetical protein
MYPSQFDITRSAKAGPAAIVAMATLAIETRSGAKQNVMIVPLLLDIGFDRLAFARLV